MPDFLRSIINRLRAQVVNRRAAPRYASHLEAGLVLSVSLSGSSQKANSDSALRVAGYTHDISHTGLALIVPSIHIGGEYLTAQNRTLEITLKLPTGPIQLQATPVRYSPLDKDGTDTGYMVGVHITQMSEPDRARYNAYLDKLTTEV